MLELEPLSTEGYGSDPSKRYTRNRSVGKYPDPEMESGVSSDASGPDVDPSRRLPPRANISLLLWSIAPIDNHSSNWSLISLQNLALSPGKKRGKGGGIEMRCGRNKGRGEVLRG